MRGCKCIPEWLKLRESGQQTCLQCNQKINIDRSVQTLVFRCGIVEKDLHGYVTQFHADKCLSTFCAQIKKNGWDRYCDVCPGLVTRDPRVEFFKNHQRTGVICQSCPLKEEEHAKFSVCSKCKVVRYCSKYCQRKDWNKHKNFCGKPMLGTEKCACFDEQDLNFFKRRDANVCSNWKCEKSVAPPFKLSTFYTPCANENGMHAISTTYCSSECQQIYN